MVSGTAPPGVLAALWLWLRIYMTVIIKFPAFVPFWNSPIKFAIEFNFSTEVCGPFFKCFMSKDIRIVCKISFFSFHSASYFPNKVSRIPRPRAAPTLPPTRFPKLPIKLFPTAPPTSRPRVPAVVRPTDFTMRS